MQYTREVFKGSERIKDERYTVRYDAQNAIVEVGPPRPRREPPPAGTPDPTPPAEEAASAENEAAVEE